MFSFAGHKYYVNIDAKDMIHWCKCESRKSHQHNTRYKTVSVETDGSTSLLPLHVSIGG